MVTALLGCHPGPRAPEPAPLLGREVTVYVAVTNAVAKNDTGNVAAMVDAIESDRREEGRSVTIVAARPDERPPGPRLEVQVLDSDSGDATRRGAGDLAGFFSGGSMLAGVGSTAIRSSGSGKIVVDAYVVRGPGLPVVYLGRVKATSAYAISDEAISIPRLGSVLSATGTPR